MFCSRCDTEPLDEAVFCPRCSSGVENAIGCEDYEPDALKNIRNHHGWQMPYEKELAAAAAAEED